MPEPTQERSAGRRAPDLSRAWTAAALSVPVTLVLVAPLSTVDLAYLVRAGQDMLASGSILRTETFTFTARCAGWVNQQWGAEVLLGATFRAGGWMGLALFRAVLVLTALWLVDLTCRRRGASERRAALLTLLAGALLLGSLTLRAQLFGIVCFAAMQWLISGRDRSLLWWAIPLEIVWANTHGSFPLGLVLLAFALAEDLQARRPAARPASVLAAAALATSVTPFGVEAWGYVFRLLGDPLIREVVREWRRPGLDTFTGSLFLVSGLAAAAVASRRWRSLPWPAWAQLAVFLLLGMTALRNVAWWGLVLPVTLARLSLEPERPPEESPPGSPTAGRWLVAAFVVVPLVAAVRWLPHAGSTPPEGLVRFAPVALTRQLERELGPDEGFIDPQAWGSWFELALPGHPVFTDSRFELIRDDVVRASLRLSRAEPGWEQTLDAIPARVLVVSRQAQPALFAEIGALEGWNEVYRDDEGAILVRDGGSAAPVPACD